LSRYVAALVALIALVLSFLAKSPGVLGLLLLVCVGATVVSLVGFVSNRVSSGSKSQVYLPTAEERALLTRRNERLRQEHEQRRAQGQRLDAPAPKPPEPPASA
jgi:hypothetical protein